MPPPSAPPQDVADAAARLTQLEPMRRGFVSERMMKCGQPACPCRDNPEARHGPYFSLTRMVGGKTRSRYLTREQADKAQQQVETGKQFRKRVEVCWEACERWADAELDATEATSEPEAAKKGASKRPSRRRSSAKSRR